VEVHAENISERFLISAGYALLGGYVTGPRHINQCLGELRARWLNPSLNYFSAIYLRTEKCYIGHWQTRKQLDGCCIEEAEDKVTER
jgi:hypothetical protein